MPPSKYKISPETVRAICCMVPPGTIAKLLNRFFNQQKIPLEELLQNQKYATHLEYIENGVSVTAPLLPTYGADGQELRSTYFKGELSRHKVLICTGLINCDARIAVDYMLVDKKNHESRVIEKMIKKIPLGIFVADAMNNTARLRSVLNEQHTDYILPLKTNNGLKSFYRFVSNEFLKAEHEGKIELSKKFLRTRHGRGELYTYYMMSVPKNHKGVRIPEGVKSLIWVKHGSARYINNTPPKDVNEISVNFHYYMSSLEANPRNFAQACHSLDVRWLYEEHHNMPGTVMMQDRMNMRDINGIDFMCGINKIVYNLMSYIRQKLSRLKGRKSRPVSFRSAFQLCAAKPIQGALGMMDYMASPPVAA